MSNGTNLNNPPGDFITVGGKLLEIARYGPSPIDAPTLVFLHHGLGCVETWRDFPAKLAGAAGCGALVYSRLGYGRSGPCPYPRPVRFMHEEGLEVLPQLLEITGIRQCILIGHSDGGSIAIIYAGGTAALPLLGVITEAPHVFFEDMTVASLQKAKESYRDGELRSKLEKYHGTNTDCAFHGWNDTWLLPGFVNWDIREYLPGIEVPLLAIQGEDDEYGTGVQVKTIEKYAGAEAKAVILPACGHAPHLEQEGAVLKIMTDFICGVLRTNLIKIF